MEPDPQGLARPEIEHQHLVSEDDDKTVAQVESLPAGDRVAPGSSLLGRRLGRYRIEGRLGAGGMGIVYRARDTRLDRDVAVKVLPPDALGDDSARARFRKEALALARMSHPNIGVVFDFATEDGVDFLAMELVVGESLDTKIATGSITSTQVVELGIQISAALQEAHEQRIIHRDLKPANIMVTPKGLAKVLDFGVARLIRRASNSDPTATHTQTEVLAGTLSYMAPEQLSAQIADERTDIWALGVVLYEMSCGRRPFQGETAFSLSAAILHGSPHPLPSDVPRGLRGVIERCLAKDPAARFSSAAEVANALEDTSSAADRSASATRVRWGRAWVTAVAGVALVGLLAMWGREGLRGPREVLSAPITSLAVMPLESPPEDPTQAQLADGMTEALIANLARTSGLARVPTRASVTPYRGTQEAVADIARALKVDALVMGAVRRSADGVVIDLSLVDAATGRTLWSDRFDRSLREIMFLQREAAQAIADQLGLGSGPLDGAPTASMPRPVDPAAYDLYLRGMTLIDRVNLADAEAAVAALEESIAIDPGFADAFGLLAQAYMTVYGSYAPQEASRLEPKVRAAIDAALSLDPDSPAAWSARGGLLWNREHGWRVEEAIEAQRRALALNPSFSRARGRLATYYNHAGLADEALAMLAQEDESPAVLFQKGLAYRIQGRQELALSAWTAIPEGSRNTNHIGHIAWTLLDLGRKEEALAMLQGVPPNTTDVNGMLAAAEALGRAGSGEREEAAALISVATARAVDTQESHHSTYLVASAYALMGELDESLRWLRFTAANGFPCYPLFADDPNFEALRTYEPFEQFVEDSKVRWEGLRARLAG